MLLGDLSEVRVQSKQRVLHPTELSLNSKLTSRRFGLTFGRNQAIADVDHRFDLQSKIAELRPESIDVNVKTLGIERLVGTPDRTPKLIRRDDAIGCSGQPRTDQKLCAGQF